MRIASNKIADIIRFFRDELKMIYEKEELETIIGFCFEEYLAINRAELVLKQNQTVFESELLKFNFAVKELRQHKPIQYILGKSDFYGLKFIVNSNVLIPRPETEELVYLIQSVITNRQPVILDIGTGSGCIAIALKKNLPDATLYAIDISGEALIVAKQNAELNKAEISFIQHNILNPQFLIPGFQFDIIVSNPPYICKSEKELMQENVLDYEPHLALFVDNSNPLIFYVAIADFAKKHLKPKGKIYFEINPIFADDSKRLLQEKGFGNVTLVKDMNNKNRILHGEL